MTKSSGFCPFFNFLSVQGPIFWSKVAPAITSTVFRVEPSVIHQWKGFVDGCLKQLVFFWKFWAIWKATFGNFQKWMKTKGFFWPLEALKVNFLWVFTNILLAFSWRDQPVQNSEHFDVSYVYVAPLVAKL